MISAAGGPRIISWNITLRCPLKCAHCYVDAGEREADGVLSTEKAFGVIDQICETGKPRIKAKKIGKEYRIEADE